MTVKAALEAWLSNRKARELAPATYRKYDYFARQLQQWCDTYGFALLTQIGVLDVDSFYASWRDNAKSKAKKLERLKQFVKFCLKRKWLTEDIAEDIAAPPGASKPANKSPFSDDELARIFAACRRIGGPVPAGPGCRSWSGEDVADMMQLMLHTGLRISDAAAFDISESLEGDRVFVRTHKTGTPVRVVVPDWLVEDLQRRYRTIGHRIFACGESRRVETQTDLWRRRMNKVFELAGRFEEPPTPHRFRHTFVRQMLQRGDITIVEIAELIGDTPEMVRRHYAKFVPERQASIDEKLRQGYAKRSLLSVVTSRHP
jgi:integrase